MTLYSNPYFYQGLLLYAILAILHAGYTYLVDARLPADDPQKRNYHPVRIILAPITLPFSLLLSLLIFVMRALFFGVCLIVLGVGLAFATTWSAARNPIRLQLPRKRRPAYQD